MPLECNVRPSEELQRIPNSELHLISHAANMSNLENAEEVNAHVLNFLGRLDSDHS
jgi:pimeloyl-ACP methyl ester carboxylesterase